MKFYVGFVEIETDCPIEVAISTNKEKVKKALQDYSCNFVKWVEEYDLSKKSLNLDLR